MTNPSLPPSFQPYRLSDFDFELPPELIAQHPAPERTASRLLEVVGGQLCDRQFTELPTLLRAGDLLLFNDTRVIKARLFATKETGGRVEILLERMLGAQEMLAQIRASHAPKPQARLRVAPGVELEVIARHDRFYHLKLHGTEPLLDVLDRHGRLPLPPYITHAPEGEDDERYQTVYAKEPGAVAAPTAGLHFDQPMLDRLAAMGVGLAYVTLHVGAGTFQPVQTEDLTAHQMHSEWYAVPAATSDAIAATRQRGGRVIAVGTTTLRTLESAADEQGRVPPGPSETRLFITPGYRFRVVDTLITNFHLPKSTLLMLVSAFAGYPEIRRAYQHAVAGRYRFFSYGDAMLLHRQPQTAP